MGSSSSPPRSDVYSCLTTHAEADDAEIQSQVGFKLYRKLELDTLKKYTAAHGHKVSLPLA